MAPHFGEWPEVKPVEMTEREKSSRQPDQPLCEALNEVHSFQTEHVPFQPCPCHPHFPLVFLKRQ